jgi:hypothetical protein
MLPHKGVPLPFSSLSWHVFLGIHTIPDSRNDRLNATSRDVAGPIPL